MRRLITAFATCVCILLVEFGHAQTNSSDAVLQTIVSGHEIENLNATDAFYTSLQRAKLPGGMVRLLSCQQQTPTFAWGSLNRPLIEVLDSIVLADPRYRWDLQKGAVNLLPMSEEPQLLRTRILQFRLDEVASAPEALDFVLSTGDVKRAMNEYRLKPGVSVVKSLSSSRMSKFSVRFNGGTLREALNTIALAQGRAVWEYTENHCSGKSEVAIRF